MNHYSTIIAATFAITSGAFGQGAPSASVSPNEPLQVKGAAPGTPAGTIPPLLQQYDFGTQIQTLQDPNALALTDGPNPVFAMPNVPRTSAQEGSGEHVPTDFRPRIDIPLSPTAAEAVRVSERWQGEKDAPAPGPDGRVMYSFGAGLATVVCAPLRVCIIELQAGEESLESRTLVIL